MKLSRVYVGGGGRFGGNFLKLKSVNSYKVAESPQYDPHLFFHFVFFIPRNTHQDQLH